MKGLTKMETLSLELLQAYRDYVRDLMNQKNMFLDYYMPDSVLPKSSGLLIKSYCWNMKMDPYRAPQQLKVESWMRKAGPKDLKIKRVDACLELLLSQGKDVSYADIVDAYAKTKRKKSTLEPKDYNMDAEYFFSHLK